MKEANSLQATAPKPLTRLSEQSGEPYHRDPVVEQQIADALALEPQELDGRAALTDAQDPRYLKEETLVYLVREHHLNGQQQLVESLSAALLGRCTGFIKGKLGSLGDATHREDAASEVVSNLFERILDPGSDRGDFLQVKFWLFLERLVGDARRRHIHLLRQEEMSSAPDWIHGSEPDDPEPGEHFVSPVAAAPDISPEDRMAAQEALAMLGEPYCTVFVLKYYRGWPVESSNPDDWTISRYYHKTSRTIRNWLTEAETRLDAWRKGVA